MTTFPSVAAFEVMVSRSVESFDLECRDQPKNVPAARREALSLLRREFAAWPGALDPARARIPLGRVRVRGDVLIDGTVYWAASFQTTAPNDEEYYREMSSHVARTLVQWLDAELRE